MAPEGSSAEMCGIAGIWDRGGATDEAARERTVAAMATALRHRGPDGDGIWSLPQQGLAFGHRRLAVIDLTEAGRQPMTSADGRYTITFNGEIYNYRALRDEARARGIEFRGESDTEVILACCMVHGLRRSLELLNGMFTFALWDDYEKILYLARDRFGEKPLYWRNSSTQFAFASELKALRADTQWDARLDRGAASAFLRFGYVPAPASIYEGVRKLKPGSFLVVPKEGSPTEESYWDLPEIARTARLQGFEGGEEAATDALEALLSDAVRRRMIADVPVGAFLSGGYDSSTIAALMAAHSDLPIETFTIGFNASGFDEASHAEKVAAYLGTRHTTFRVGAAEARAVVPQLGRMYDEPFADSSQIPTHLVSALTRNHVTVALSGDGGDEMFSGYNRYKWTDAIWRRSNLLPRAARLVLANMIHATPQNAINALFLRLPERLALRQPGHKAHRVADVMSATDLTDAYRSLVSQWSDPAQLVSGTVEAQPFGWDAVQRAQPEDFVDRMRMWDLLGYLPDDILTKVDRASMAVSLEVRVPFLDPAVLEFSWQLPTALNARAPRPKHLLRRVLARYVPDQLVDRPKTGFGVPLADWLRGSLRDWGEDLLSPERLQNDDLLAQEPIRAAWEDFQAGDDRHQYRLWAVLMLQQWRDEWAMNG